MEQIRSFIAIELPEELRRELAQLEAQLTLRKLPGVKWVDPNRLHLTLKFLGNVASDKISEILEVLAVAAQVVSPFHLELKTLGVFPNLRRVQVVWVGITGEVAKLSQLEQSLESNLSPLGFPPESRPFLPHLTLARLGNQVSLPERQRIGQLITTTRFEAKSTIKVAAVSLMRSQLTREGAIYTRISSAGLSEVLPTKSS